MKNTFLTKSLDPTISDEKLEGGTHVVSFMSFRRALEQALKQEGLSTINDVKGYRVTEQGIEILWK